MKCLEVGESFDCQAMFVRFTLSISPVQKLGKTLPRAFCLNTVSESSVYAQRAINGRGVH